MFFGTPGLYTDIFCTAGLKKLWIKCVIFIISFTLEILLRICNFFTVRSLDMLRSYAVNPGISRHDKLELCVFYESGDLFHFMKTSSAVFFIPRGGQ